MSKIARISSDLYTVQINGTDFPRDAILHPNCTENTYNVFSLVDSKQYSFSPMDENEDVVECYIRRYNNEKGIPNPPSTVLIHNNTQFSILAKMALKIQVPEEKELNEKALRKWCKDQGGSFSKDQVTKNIWEYLMKRPINKREIKQTMKLWVHWMKKHMAPVLNTQWVLRSACDIYNAYKGDHRSSGGTTYPGDRRQKTTRVLGVKQMKDHPFDHASILSGMRRKDGKDRNIYEDAASNYYRDASAFSRLFETWREIPFNFTVHHYTLEEQILALKAKLSYAADFKAMDQHYVYYVALCLLCAFRELYNIPMEDFWYMAKILRGRYRHVTLRVADEMWLCEWVNHLSGMYITHDFESPVTHMILLRTLYECGFNVVFSPRPLKKNEAYIVVNGDDSSVFFGRQIGDELRDRIAYKHAEVASWFGQIIEVSKVDWSSTDTIFCKRKFPLQLLPNYKRITLSDGNTIAVPLYSIIKALWAIYHPEDLPPLDDSIIIAKFCGIMDNAYGSHAWAAIIATIHSWNRDVFAKISPDLSPEARAFINRDWWMSNYVEFELKNSPTYNYLVKLNNGLATE